MTHKPTMLILATVALFGASLLAFATNSEAAQTDKRLFERSIHGSYAPIPRIGNRTIALAAASQGLVSAKASATGQGGYWVRRFKARFHALRQWRIKAAIHSGPGATRWTLARHKTVTCSAVTNTVRCTVSAAPATPQQRLGFASY